MNYKPKICVKISILLLLVIFIIFLAFILKRQITLEKFNNKNKKIFIYWDKKFENAPDITKKCLTTWKNKNPTWNVIELDDANLINYIDIEKEIPNIKKKNISKAAYSDIIRIFLLEKYGGCWCDATLFCNKPLDKWLNKNISTGFFAFDKPGPDRMVSSWFLYCDKNNYIVKEWKKKTVEYWKNKDKPHHYYWFHYLFGDLYKSNNKFKKMWDLTPKISAGGPHYFLSKRFNTPITNEIKQKIDSKEIPVYKLTYKFDKSKIDENSIIVYLLSKYEEKE